MMRVISYLEVNISHDYDHICFQTIQSLKIDKVFHFLICDIHEHD